MSREGTTALESHVKAIEPAIRRTLKTVSTVAALAAVSGVAAWWILVGGWLLDPGWQRLVSVLVLLLLLAPAAGTAAAVAVMRSLMFLPAQLSRVSEDAMQVVSAAREEVASADSRGARIVAFGRALWRSRRLAASGKASWLRAVGALKLIKLPALLALMASLVLCFPVIAFGVVVLLAGLVTLLL